MWRIRVLLVAGALMIPAIASCGTIELSWKTCVQPNANHVVVGPASVAGLFAWVSNSDDHKGYRIAIRLRPAGPGALPDAWRFDATGCQTDPFAFVARPHGPAGFSKCIDVAGFVSSTSTEWFDYDATTGTAQFGLEHDYAQLVAGRAATRMFAAEFVFDHATSVSGTADPGQCGGVESLVCFSLEQADWFDADGALHPWTALNSVVTAAGVGVAPDPCLATAARPSSWGRLKATFR